MSANFCLMPLAVDKFKAALRSGLINPEDLTKMTSEERHDFFASIVGEENAKGVNALFESKLLLKNQQRGMVSWAKRVAGMSPQAKRDLISRIERMDKILSPAENEQFLRDLAESRLGIGVTQEEAKTISELSNKSLELRKKANDEGVFPTEEDRLAYGMSRVQMEEYVNNLKLQSRKISFRQPLRKVKSLVTEVPGTMKSLVASLDNSMWGRQGIKVLLDTRTSGIWAKNFAKSWVDIAHELKGTDAMTLVKADIYSRPNALNGKYRVGKYGLDVLTEEAFPSSLPEKIPAFGRLFKASEAAYNGGALRLRADLADRLIKRAEKQGINTLNKEQAEGMGHLVGSITGRGSLGKADVISKEVNVLLFSIKFLKANIDTLTAHQFDPKSTPFSRSEARKNLFNIVVTVAAILTIAKMLDKNSVDQDPRSSHFGKIKMFGHWVDITGGMASLATLSSRLVPTWHNGKFSFWTKSSSGVYTDLLEKKYGQQNALDVFEQFWEGKLSPVAGIARDIWKGSTFGGKTTTAEGEIKGTTTPLSIQSYQQFKNDPESSNVLGSMILEGLGFSTQTTIQKDWNDSPTKELTQFREKVGQAKFDEANKKFNADYANWLKTDEHTFKDLPDDQKQSLMTNQKKVILSSVFKDYGFKYQKSAEEKKATADKAKATRLKNKQNSK